MPRWRRSRRGGRRHAPFGTRRIRPFARLRSSDAGSLPIPGRTSTTSSVYTGDRSNSRSSKGLSGTTKRQRTVVLRGENGTGRVQVYRCDAKRHLSLLRTHTHTHTHGGMRKSIDHDTEPTKRENTFLAEWNEIDHRGFRGGRKVSRVFEVLGVTETVSSHTRVEKQETAKTPSVTKLSVARAPFASYSSLRQQVVAVTGNQSMISGRGNQIRLRENDRTPRRAHVSYLPRISKAHRPTDPGGTRERARSRYDFGCTPACARGHVTGVRIAHIQVTGSNVSLVVDRRGNSSGFSCTVGKRARERSRGDTFRGS